MTDADRDSFWRAFLNESHTEPMTRAECCEWFGYHANCFGKLSASLPGLQEFAGRVRVPLRSMPPSYFIRRGMAVANESLSLTISQQGSECSDISEGIKG